MDTQQEDAERYEFQRRVPDYIALHESVSSSTALLDSLASFLSTFQHDLASVAGEIGELQVHSTDIEGRSKGRKSLAKPLDALIGEIILSPQLITTIRDTRPGDAWLGAVKELEDKIRAVKARGEVRAAHDVGMVVEGLKQKVSLSGASVSSSGAMSAKTIPERGEGAPQAIMLAKRPAGSLRASGE